MGRSAHCRSLDPATRIVRAGSSGTEELVASANSERGGTPEFDRALTVFTDEVRRAEAIRSRSRLGNQRAVDAVSGTFLGTLTEVAENAQPVTILTENGSTHRGSVAAIGSDVLVLDPAGDDRRILLAHASIEGLREVGAGHTRRLDRAPQGATFVELLDGLAGDGVRISVLTRGGNRVRGTLVRAGDDQVTIRLDGDGDVMTMPVAALSEAVVG